MEEEAWRRESSCFSDRHKSAQRLVGEGAGQGWAPDSRELSGAVFAIFPRESS